MSFDFIEEGNTHGDAVRSMIIIASHKIGKTSAVSNLENSLVIDLEDSAGYYPGKHINIKKIAAEKSEEAGKTIHPCEVYMKIAQKLNTQEGKNQFDYIVIDTLTVLSEYAEYLGKKMHKASPKGDDFDMSDSLFALDYGLGYGIHRDAMTQLIEMFSYPGKPLILIAHKKDSIAHTSEGDIDVTDINLIGQLKTIIPSRVDAVATMEIDEKDPYKRILSFVRHSKDIVTGTRLPHLSNKEIVISELKNPDTDDEKLVTYWDKIFINKPE